MALRIAVAGFQHESNSFAPRPTVRADFDRPGGMPPFSVAQAVIAALDGTRFPLQGAIEAAIPGQVELVPLAYAMAMPAGPVEASAFNAIAGEITDRADRAHRQHPLDGLYLDLHGAMVATHAPDGEGELLRRLRARLGPDLPIAVSLDSHANVTEAMVRLASVLTAYRTYPHVDMWETGARALRLLLLRIRRGRPFETAFRRIPFLIPITAQCTLEQPMHGLFERRAVVEAAIGVAELGVAPGFPYADFDGCGPTVWAAADTQDAARRAVDAMAEAFEQARPALREASRILGARDGVAAALEMAGKRPGRPVVLADTQDNPGGGGEGDTTGLLAALHDAEAAGAVLGVLNDPATAADAHARGVGATLNRPVGGASDGAPWTGEVRVLALSDGRFTCTGPMTQGSRADLGPMARLVTSAGVELLVSSRKMQALDQAMFRTLGVEPGAVPILALKSSVHFRADFGPIAAVILVVAAPGPVVADPAALPWSQLPAGLALSP